MISIFVIYKIHICILYIYIDVCTIQNAFCILRNGANMYTPLNMYFVYYVIVYTYMFYMKIYAHTTWNPNFLR